MRRFALVLCLILLAPWAHGASNPIPVGTEFQVNTYTTGAQFRPAVATAADGSFIVAWQSVGSGGNDPGQSIQAQRFTAAGIPLGGETQVNTFTTSTQSNPAVAAGLQGEFVVVWQSHGSAGTDSDAYSIQGQRYDASGTAEGSQFQVNTHTPATQQLPAVAFGSDGGFVVVWESDSATGDSSMTSIQGQRYANDGAAGGQQFQVNSYTTSYQRAPAMGSNLDGQLVVVWSSAGSDGGDTALDSIRGQRYVEPASPDGTEAQINSYTTNNQSRPAVAVAPDGSFVVAWDSYGSFGGDTSGTSVQARLHRVDGAPLAPELQVNTYTNLIQSRATLAVDRDGDFVLVWQSSGASAGDPSGYSIQGRRFAADGQSLGSQFQVNTFTTNHQLDPAIAIHPDGDFVVAWHSYASAGDASYGSVQAQRFRVTGDLAGRVFFDQDFDGMQDGSEPGLPRVEVELYDEALTLRRTAVTDGNGDYTLRPKEGSWHLRFVRPSTYSFTGRDAGSDDELDSDADPTTGETDPFPIALGVLDTSRDAGLTTGIGDKVWHDLDRDGVREGGEPGLAGVTVRLRDKGGSEVAATVTDAAGRYHVNTIPPGEYYVQFEAPSGFAFSPAHQGGNDETDSDADAVTGASPIFTFALADVDVTLDAGLRQLTIFADGFESGDAGGWSAAVP